MSKTKARSSGRQRKGPGKPPRSSSTPKAGSKKARAEARRRAARRKRNLTVAGVGAAGLLLVVLVVAAFVGGPSEPDGVVDRTGWELPVLDGEGTIALADFAGKPTVAAFFASWCTICRAELPSFVSLSQAVGDQVNFVGINTMDRGSGLGFAREMGIDVWPLARDVGGLDGRGLATAFGARGSPTTVIYAPDGSVADVTLGRLTAEQLAEKLHTLFGVSA